MKKLLLLVAVVSISFGAMAQFQMGAKFGLNMSKLKPAYITSNNADVLNKTYDENTKSALGMNLGFVMCLGGGKVFSFQPEFAFAQRGSRYVDNDGKTMATEKMNYFDVKPLFNLGYGGDSWRAYFQFGPSINFWLSKKTLDADGKFIDKSDEWHNDSEDVDGSTDVRLDIGWVMGFGFKYKLGPGWILFNPRYELGILPTTIYDLGSDGFSTVNRTISINAGYLFQF